MSGGLFFKFHFLECNTEQYLDMVVVVVDDFRVSVCVESFKKRGSLHTIRKVRVANALATH